MIGLTAAGKSASRAVRQQQIRVYDPQHSRRDRATPRVTVVVPCYNYRRYLADSVASALNQADVDVDVVIVDDASSDDSGELARILAERDRRITVVQHESNMGPVSTFNDGLERATGEFIVRLDADDLLTSGSLARSVQLLDAFPDVGMVYGHPVHFAGDPPASFRSEVQSWTVWPGQVWLRLRCDLGVNCITAPEVVMRHDVVRRVGGQRELAHTHDMEMWMRLAAVADVGHVEGCDQALHREHPDSLSARHVNPIVDLEERRQAFEVLFSGVAGRLPDARELHAAARRALAVYALDRACRAYDRGNTGGESVDWYVQFALNVCEDTSTLPQWRALRRRQAVGPRFAPLMPPFFARAVLRRLGDEMFSRRWAATGL